MIAFALSFVAGAWLLQQMPALPDMYWALAMLPIALLAYKLPTLRLPLLALAGLLAGFFWAAGYAQHRLSYALPSAWEGQNIQMVGVVATMPQAQERGQRFEFDVEQVVTAGAVVPRHISLAHYSAGFGRVSGKPAVTSSSTSSESSTLSASGTLAASAMVADSTTFRAGERWRLTVRLKRPHGTVNPYGYDFEAWALERNIRATGYVRKDPQNARLASFVFKPGYLVEAARERIHRRMSNVLVDRPYAGVLQALAIGDDSAIAQGDWQVFLRTGTNHLVSISGLHITMLSGFAFALMYFLWRRSELLSLRLPARKAGVVAGAVVALLYALIAGYSVPTQRTLYMLAVFAWALWSGRNVGILRVLAYALLLVVVLDPWSVLAPGFWLSFGAVAFISYALGGRLRNPHWLPAAVYTQWAVTLGLIPILLVLFQQVSILSPLANAVAIPVISLVIVPLTLMGALLPIDSALQLAHVCMAACMQFLLWIAALPFSTWQQQAPPLWTLPVALMGVLLVLLPRGIPLRWLGLIAFLPMLLITPVRPEPGAMQLAVLDVGQGLAVAVRTAHHNLLYDTGPGYSSQSDSGNKIIVPYLRAAGMQNLHGMIVSHDDSDHSGGMVSVLSQVPVGWVLSSLAQDSPMLAALPMAGKPHGHCVAGQHWQWDGVQFDMLAPTAASYEDTTIKDNNRSCVLRISSRFGSVLLVGDIEKQVEAELLQQVPTRLAADVLVVPHHGSKTSSTPNFVKAVHPQAAIFTVGYRNRFRHPRQEILARYAEQGAKTYRSDWDGAIVLEFGDKNASSNLAFSTSKLDQSANTLVVSAQTGNISITRWRPQDRRYWHSIIADDIRN